MKKDYVRPQVKIYQVRVQSMLMTGSENESVTNSNQIITPEDDDFARRVNEFGW